MHALLAQPGHAVTKERLYELVFPGQLDVQYEAIEVVVYRLRKTGWARADPDDLARPGVPAAHRCVTHTANHERTPASHPLLRRRLLLGILVPVIAFISFNTYSLYHQTLASLHTAYDRTLLASAKSISEQLDVEATTTRPRSAPSCRTRRWRLSRRTTRATCSTASPRG